MTFKIIAYGKFGPCYVEDEIGASADEATAKQFNTLAEAEAFRDKHWPKSEVATAIVGE